MAVEAENIRTVTPRRPVPAQQELAYHQAAPKGPSATAQILHFFALILAVRLFLFLSLIGAFVLAWVAIHAETTASLAVFVAYDILVIFPLVYLDLKGKSAEGN